MLTVGWLQRTAVGPPRRYEVELGPAARILDIELEHELSYWIGQMAQRERWARLPWPLR